MDEKLGFVPFQGVQVTSPSSDIFQGLFSITGMTCSACVRAISEGLESQPYVKKANVVLLASSAIVDFVGQDRAADVTDMIQDLGYGAILEEVKPLVDSQAQKSRSKVQSWEASFTIDGLKTTSDVSAIKEALEKESWIQQADFDVDSGFLTIMLDHRRNLCQIPSIIKAVNRDYCPTLVDLLRIREGSAQETGHRTVSIRVTGVSDEANIMQLLVTVVALKHKITIEKWLSLKDPVLTITYSPKPPDFTIRHILAAIDSTVPTTTSFTASIYHPPTIEERARAMHARERRHVIYRVLLALFAAIPSFIIGIVFMSLVSNKNKTRVYLMSTWANVSRAQWSLFIISTPVYFFAADLFHRRAFKELVALWRPGSSVPLFRRFYRFGSMNLLMSMGTSIAYFASIVELIITSRQSPHSIQTGYQSFYFDSVVFLTLFLLIGRLIEAWSRAKTADAVTSLGRLRPTNAVIYSSSRSNKEQEGITCNTSIDTIETGDLVLISHGASPPVDGLLLDDSGSFDESSLTGESKVIQKVLGDDLMSGTINKGSPVLMRATNIVGTSMLDQIIKVVREGQTRRAPVEKIGDTVTSYFVPVITATSISTWIIWLALGETGSLPPAWLDVQSGGWPYWSLQFSIAVFIIACPCGFGLAAPTAMFVGGGIAAKHGILAKGGGEAFQAASKLDIVVFDKTGTLTEGGNPSVTECENIETPSATAIEPRLLFSLVRATEEKSNHPIAGAVVRFLKDRDRVAIHSTSVEELTGRGMKGLYTSEKFPGKSYMILVGNERLMSENGVEVNKVSSDTLDSWKFQGKSIVLVSVRITDIDSSTLGKWALHMIAAVSDPIRPESAAVIQNIQNQNIDVWMISGDNETTARAVGVKVGIPADKIIAGVLPEQKSEKIQELQRSTIRTVQQWPFQQQKSSQTSDRAIVAMVGDGVNDSPALAVADVGIAIGSGSDVAISTADFVLLSSNLSSVVVLIHLSGSVFQRIKFNFGWALVYNLIALPIAAGVLYPVQRHGSHIRLDPVWASLAMALSSISVVSSSLALKTRLPYLGFRKPVLDLDISK